MSGDSVHPITLHTEYRDLLGLMLAELAARLRPGPAFGPDESGTDLANTVGRIAADLIVQAYTGRRPT